MIDSSSETPEQSAMRVWDKIKSMGLIDFGH